MFQVLVAQSCHQNQINSCIHRGMEIRFSNDTKDCMNKIMYSDIDVLIIKADVHMEEGICVHQILNAAEDDQIAVFLISETINEEVLDLLFHHNVNHYFMEPVSFQDIFDKLEKLRGHEEGLNLERRTGELLHTLGIPNSVQGYGYLLNAIISCYYHEDYMKGITKRLYPFLACEHSTTAGAVEKSIRHAIEMAFSHSDQSLLYSFFKGTIRPDKAKATNSQFIAMCVNYMKNEGM